MPAACEQQAAGNFQKGGFTVFWAPAATAITIMMLTLIVRAMHCKHQGIPVWNNIFQSKATLGAYFLLRSFVLVTLVRSLYLENYQHAFLCLLSLVLFAAPIFLERNLKIKLPAILEIVISYFIFSAEILGEVNNYYGNIPGWDTILHTINGFLCAAVGFALVDMLNRSQKISLHLSPVYLSLMAFCFSMTIGVLWEFFEFGADQLMELDMQKDFIISSFSSVTLDPTASGTAIAVEDIARTTIETASGEVFTINGYLDIGIIDTMKDLMVNFVGAVVFSVIGYFYTKNNGKGTVAKQFIPVVLDCEKGGKAK